MGAHMPPQRASEPDEDVRQQPQDALRQMLNADGFAMFREYARSEWGSAAVVRKITAALSEHPASEHSMLTQSIIGMQAEVFRLFAWPEEEIARLETAEKRPPGDRFQQHRRV